MVHTTRGALQINFSSIRRSPTMRPQQDSPDPSIPAVVHRSSHVMLRFLGPMPGGDHSSPGRVRKPVGPLGPPSPSGVHPTPASCVGQPFGVPGEPVHLA